MIEAGRKRLKFVLAGLWLAFTITFAIWWMILGFQLIHEIQRLLQETTPTLEAQKRMMLWEGSAWAILLLGGGLWLIWLLRREEKRSRVLKEFFAAFSHDIKTAITSLRLQAESIEEDLGGRELPALQRLVADTVRLQVQLENSLFLSQAQDFNIHLESLSFSKLIQSIRYQWPNIEIELNQDAAVRVDERAMKTVVGNLIHNAVMHGEASKISFNLSRVGSKKVKVEFFDDGKGFQGQVRDLGMLFYRHNRSSGSGVGLFVAKDLLKRMGAQIEFLKRDQGFGGVIELEGNLL